MFKIVKDLDSFAGGKGIAKKIGIVICNPCFHAVVLYRLSNLFYKIHLAPFAKLTWYVNRLFFHVDIDYHAELAGGFHLVHGLGTVIGKDVKSMGNLTVYQGVTLGGSGKFREYKGKTISQPIIENDVYVYANAMVLGPVVISKNSKVLAGERVTHDI